jgi:hypothetical protein
MEEGNGQLCSIKSKHSGRVLDVCQDIDRKGMLIIYDDYKGPNQLFISKFNGKEVEFICKQSGKSLTVAANSTKNGAPIFEELVKGLEGQRFRL